MDKLSKGNKWNCFSRLHHGPFECQEQKHGWNGGEKGHVFHHSPPTTLPMNRMELGKKLTPSVLTALCEPPFATISSAPTLLASTYKLKHYGRGNKQ